MITGNLSFAPDLAHDTVKITDGQRSDDSSFKHCAQGAGIAVNLTGIQHAQVV